jgi:hypothetical protein
VSGVDGARWQQQKMRYGADRGDGGADVRMLPIWHLDGVDWLTARLPRRWHRCTPQSVGFTGLDRIHRCACGVMSFDGELWMEKNSRRL